jgi:hypothetical protein
MTDKKPMIVYAATYPSVSAAETDLMRSGSSIRTR